MIQVKTSASLITEVLPHLEPDLNLFNSDGIPLDVPNRAFFESCFKHDFNQVHSHRPQH